MPLTTKQSHSLIFQSSHSLIFIVLMSVLTWLLRIVGSRSYKTVRSISWATAVRVLSSSKPSLICPVTSPFLLSCTQSQLALFVFWSLGFFPRTQIPTASAVVRFVYVIVVVIIIIIIIIVIIIIKCLFLTGFWIALVLYILLLLVPRPYWCPGHRPWARVIICVGFFFVLFFLR